MSAVSTTAECLQTPLQPLVEPCPNTTITFTHYGSTVIVSNNSTITEKVLTVTQTVKDPVIQFLSSNEIYIGLGFIAGIVALTMFLFRRNSGN